MSPGCSNENNHIKIHAHIKLIDISFFLDHSLQILELKLSISVLTRLTNL